MMHPHKTKINQNSHEEFYHDGYQKGRDDALCGIPFKLLSALSRLSSEKLQSWEDGYKQGYLESLTRQT